MGKATKTLGRRQFLMAAGAASTSVLAAGRLSGGRLAGLRPDPAAAAQSAATVTGSYSRRYRRLLSPLRIGDVVLKNRMMSTRSLPYYLQGPETFPADPIMCHIENLARNGAAIITLGTDAYDLGDSDVQTYLAQLTDAIHFYGARASVALTQFREPQGYNISAFTAPEYSGQRKYFLSGEYQEMPAEMIRKMNAGFANTAKAYQSLGFDMACIYMSYRSSIYANTLSPALNKRTDEYGGSHENRARMVIELCEAIKQACGRNFLIDAQVSGEEEEAGGYTLADMVTYAKLFEGYVDILQLRGPNLALSHPMGQNFKKGSPITLRYAEAIKKSGARIAVAPVGGYQDLDFSESILADGKADIIAMARAFIADPGYGRKAYEGRGEDVVPCILCNRCHGVSSAPLLDVCSVNPEIGIAQKSYRMVVAPVAPRKVAVIGGGPAGMKAALTAAERGHAVTLYEKGAVLGGQLRHADYASFQWPLKDYKDYLIRQVEKAGVTVRLNTAATPRMIEKEKYDAVLVAIGAQPVATRLSGGGTQVYGVTEVFGREKELGKRVVVIGSGKIGGQTGMYLAECGHAVTVLTSGDDVLPAEGAHQVIDTYLEMANFSFKTQVTVTGISGGKVAYTDAKGRKQSVPADSVVVYAGFKPLLDEAMAFADTADRFFMAGDCLEVGGYVRACTRTAFAAASQL